MNGVSGYLLAQTTMWREPVLILLNWKSMEMITQTHIQYDNAHENGDIDLNIHVHWHAAISVACLNDGDCGQ